MRVAALYDIHGNLPALESVLAEIPGDAEILVGGDVATGGFPARTLETLRALDRPLRWIRGNADRQLAEAGGEPDEGTAWTREQLAGEQIAFLHGLPRRLELDLDGLGRALFCHASPRGDEDVFTEVTPEERVAPLLAGVDAALVVVGHTHLQFERTVAGMRVVDPGSVGISYEDEPGARWALLGADGIEQRCTPFVPRASGFPGWGESPPSRAEAVAEFERRAAAA